MVKISGHKKHLRRLKSMSGRRAVEAVGQAVFAAADEGRVEAQLLISQGSTQGDNHVPSRPGQPPNWDTGALAGGITARKTGPVTSQYESAAPHAVPLEIGTPTMAARPYMAPTAPKVRRRAKLLVSAALNSVIRRP